MIDLWPEGIETNRVKSPVTILREQGSLLGQKTKNLVQGEVMESSGRENLFVYSFFIVAPALSHYRYKLFTIRHDVSLYPVRVDVEDRIFDEVDSQFQTGRSDPDGEPLLSYLQADSEEKFLELLREIFKSQKAIQVVTSLLSQSDPNWRSSNGEVASAS
ncbi:MAG: hypothetical protein Kow00121_59790 [Elainellaceae cyanobacterium]